MNWFTQFRNILKPIKCKVIFPKTPSLFSTTVVVMRAADVMVVPEDFADKVKVCAVCYTVSVYSNNQNFFGMNAFV